MNHSIRLPIVRLLSFWSLAALALFTPGCVRSVAPILKDDQLITNSDVVGRWVSDDGKQSIQVDPQSAADKTYTVRETNEDGTGGLYIVRLGKVQDLTIAEILPCDPSPQGGPKGDDEYKAHFLPLHSFLILYETKPNIVVSTLDSDWLGKFLQKSPNELRMLGEPKDGIINCSTEELQQFLLKHYKDPDAMSKPSRLVHPGDPTTQPGFNGHAT